MPMKKITFNAPLNHKAYSYEPMQIEVEKSLPSAARVPYESIDDYECNWGDLFPCGISFLH